MPTITDIEGVGEVYGVKLRQAGVKTTESLLQKGRTPKGRQELAKATGFSTKMILELGQPCRPLPCKRYWRAVRRPARSRGR